MRHTFTEALIQESEWIPADEKEIILFGLQQGKSMVNSILITLAIGIIMNLFWESVLFVICFFPLRRYAGGFHAKTQLRCMVISISAIITAFLLLKTICWTKWLIVLCSAACFFIICFTAPVANEKRVLEAEEKRIFGRKAKIIAGIQFIFTMALVYSAQYQAAAIIVVSYFLVIFCLFAGQIKISYFGKS
ncbi:accessory gene regulator B [Lachnospiraceae bacterium NLAE-zl-G231]|nr:accessory gene regulator B [Lachnospiraceae bacterium NLAE-zl-G231]